MDRTLLALSLAFAIPMQALVELEIDEKHPAEVRFSTSSHNRISIENGGVEKVFGDGSIFSVTIDPSTGNAFINVLKEIGEKPTVLTLITNSGLIQDFLVSSDEGLSEQIHLKEKEEEEVLNYKPGSHSSTIDLLNQILEGKVPFGYGQKEPEEKDDLHLPEPLLVSTKKVFEGPFEWIAVYQIENLGKEPVVLSPEALKKEEGSWVFLSAHELQKREQALCLIGRPKEER